MIFNDPLNITGYSQPALVGSNATFSCPLGLEQTGPKSSTCMENGEWEPDPREVECKGDYYLYLLLLMYIPNAFGIIQQTVVCLPLLQMVLFFLMPVYWKEQTSQLRV